MIGWLFRFLFGGCEHKWVVHREYKERRVFINYGQDYIKVISRCTKCGNIKSQEF